MERTPVILGLTRQAKLWGLPLPYTLAVSFITMLPFMWLDSLLWLFTGLVWYLAARIFTVTNPNGALLFFVVTRKTPRALFRPNAKKGRRYV